LNEGPIKKRNKKIITTKSMGRSFDETWGSWRLDEEPKKVKRTKKESQQEHLQRSND